MRLGEAIDRMNKAYVPGCAKFYDQFTPDPWFDANDILEKVLLEGTVPEHHPNYEAWLNRMLFLIEKYQEFQQTGTKYQGVVDACDLGDPELATRASSRRSKRCFKCDTKIDLTLTSEIDSRRIAVVCRSCLKSRVA